MKTMTHKLDKFDFGKHKGKTVREVIAKDPEYIFWLAENNIANFSQELLDNATDSLYDMDVE